MSDFRDAVANVGSGADPNVEAASLVAAMTTDERLGCLDGDLPFWPGLADMMSGGYHRRTWPAAEVARLGIPGLAFADGRALRIILTAEAPTQTIPERESTLQVLLDYGRLGIEHLVTGIDHVLFVLGLLLLIGGGRRLVGAITAFTVGHSITLVLASFGTTPLPQTVVEIGIALSIVVLAVELVRSKDRPAGLLARRPWLMSFSFGLLHGLGFAGALAELGLPAHAIPLALFSFNVGIEVGQLGIVALALPLIWLLANRVAARQWIEEVPATAIGSLGAYWCIERSVSALLG